MKQKTIMSYFNKEVKTEWNERGNIKEEIDIDWSEMDNYYETTFDDIKTEPPMGAVSDHPSNAKTGKKNAIEKTKNTRECPKCKRLLKKRNYHAHAHFCTKDRNLQCAHCVFKTKYKRCLSGHISRMHPEGIDAHANHKPQIQKYCQKCDKSYELTRIISCEICSSKLLSQCSVCNKKFEDRRLANYHWETRCGVKGFYHCHSCDYKAVFRTSVIKHSQRAHKNAKSNETVQWKSVLNVGENQVSSSYECSKCLKRMSNNHKLNLHLKMCQVAENGEKSIASSNSSDPNRCSLCSKKFGHIYLLNKHISHCMRNQRMAKRTSDSDDEIIEVVEDHPPVTLISADEISAGIKQRAVKYCDKCMVESEIEERWGKNGQSRDVQCHNCKTTLTFKCKKCLKKFSSKRQILPHLNSMCYPKEFQCTKCDYKSFRARRVREHYRVTHEIVDTECKKCGKKLKNFVCLRAHIKRCGMEPKLQCDHCPFKSKIKPELKAHIFRRHMEVSIIDKRDLLKISRLRFSRALIHLEGYCFKCKKKQGLKNRLKICKKCKTKLTFKCKTCKKNYVFDDEDACEHVKAYLETIKFECKSCARGMISKNSLTAHKSRCGVFPCRFCKFVSNISVTRARHEQSKHPGQV